MLKANEFVFAIKPEEGSFFNTHPPEVHVREKMIDSGVNYTLMLIMTLKSICIIRCHGTPHCCPFDLLEKVDVTYKILHFKLN